MSPSFTKFSNRSVQLIGKNVAVSSFLALFLAASLSATFSVAFKNTLGTLNERIGSLPWTLFPENVLEERVTIVSIDEKSISEIGPWPWSREVMAELVSRINETGAQLQIHDVLYPVGARPGDDLFADALLENRSSIIAQLPVIQAQSSPLQSGLLTHPVNGFRCANQGPESGFPSTDNFIGASGALESVPKGHIAPIIERDGSVNRLPALICADSKAYPALAITPFLQLTNSNDWGVRVSRENRFFGPEKSLSLDSFPGLNIPLDGDGNLRISFRKSPTAFLSVPAIDVLNGNYDPSMFDNAFVLLGATAFGLDDIVPTPYSGVSPGVELQARVLTSILDNNTPYSPRGQGLITILISSVIAVLLFFVASLRGRAALIGLPCLAFFSSFLALLAHGAFLNTYHLWIGWIAPAMFGFFGGLVLLVVEHARVRFERSMVMQNLSSYLPDDAAKKVAFQLPTSNIQAERCEVTLLSADLRNFAALGESRPPEESASVLHYFFTKVSEIVESHGGRIHEYKGDSVLAVWDGDGCGPAAKALSAALDIENQVNANLLSEVRIDDLQPLAVGVGIEQGPALVGSIGPAHRRAHTLCGEVVTVTLRIQEMTAELAYPVLIGEVLARYLPDTELQMLGHYLLPGLAKAHVLFSPKQEELPTEGLKLLKGGLG